MSKQDVFHYLDETFKGQNSQLCILLVTVLDVLFAAFSAPNITRSDNSLIAYAQKWLPKPGVIWSDQKGKLLNSSTQFYNMTVMSILLQVNDETYTCAIQNTLVTAVSEATVMGRLFLLFIHINTY